MQTYDTICILDSPLCGRNYKQSQFINTTNYAALYYNYYTYYKNVRLHASTNYITIFSPFGQHKIQNNDYKLHLG